MSSAPFQHFSMAVFRAVENRRPVVRAANTGISAFILPNGKIAAQSGLFTETLLTKEIDLPDSGLTLYTRYGDFFAIALTLLSAVNILIVCWYTGRRSRRTR